MTAYSTLGIEPNASPDEIKKAYRKAIKKYHPDVNKTDDAKVKFAEITSAYEELTSDKSQQFKNSFEDIFANFNRGFRDFDINTQPRNLHASYIIDIVDAYNGVDADLSYHIDTGELKSVKFKIPPGIHSGERIVCSGYGQRNGAAVSDLIVTIIVNDTEKFRRVGHDVVVTQTIGVITAMAGGSLVVDTISGSKVKVVIPAGIQPNSKLRIQKSGMPVNGGYGSMIIVIIISIPSITEDQRNKIANILQSS